MCLIISAAIYHTILGKCQDTKIIAYKFYPRCSISVVSAHNFVKIKLPYIILGEKMVRTCIQSTTVFSVIPILCLP